MRVFGFALVAVAARAAAPPCDTDDGQHSAMAQSAIAVRFGPSAQCDVGVSVVCAHGRARPPV